MMKRTKARLKINQILTGKKTNLRVVGCLLFREWSEKDKRFYYWEEWEITGLADYDTWVEYDHSDDVVSLYEPIRFTRPIDPQQLKKGQSFTLSEQGGTDHVVVVDEVGVGEIVNIKGKNTYQVFPKEMMAYATLRDSKAPKGRQLITIEKYNNREYDAYRKVKLDAKEQKRIFGRTITPINWWMIIFIVFIATAVIFTFLDNSSSDGHSSGARGVYGGSSGGFGK